MEEDSFADFGLAASIPVFPTEHNYIGSPINAQRSMPSSGTPIHELRARVNAVRAALTSNLQQTQVVDASLTGRERDIALKAERDFEPTIKYVFFGISAMSKIIVVPDVIKAGVAEALQPVSERL